MFLVCFLKSNFHFILQCISVWTVDTCEWWLVILDCTGCQRHDIFALIRTTLLELSGRLGSLSFPSSLSILQKFPWDFSCRQSVLLEGSSSFQEMEAEVVSSFKRMSPKLEQHHLGARERKTVSSLNGRLIKELTAIFNMPGEHYQCFSKYTVNLHNLKTLYTFLGY